MYTCLCTGGFIIPWGRSPGVSIILCASWEARILCDQAHTVSEKLVCISYRNGVSSDALPSHSAQPENLLGMALKICSAWPRKKTRVAGFLPTGQLGESNKRWKSTVIVDFIIILLP